MVSLTGWITLYSTEGMESFGFRTVNIRPWLHNSINNQRILLGERFLYLGAPVINHHVRFLLQERDLRQGCVRLILEIVAEDSFGGLDVGYVRLPFKDIVLPGWVIPVRSQIQSSNQGSAIGVLNLAVYTELPVNYPHPSPAPQALHPNLGYRPVAPQANFQPRRIFVNAVSHFLGGIVGEMGSQVINQDSGADGLPFADLLASFFM